MSKASDFYKGIQDAINNAVKRLEPFRAIVTNGNTGGKVQIQRLGADAADAETYARLEGTQLDAGDEAAIINLGGQPFVLGKIQRSSPLNIKFDRPLVVNGAITSNSTLTGAAIVGTTFNSPRFHVATDTSPTTASTTVLNTWTAHGSTSHALPTGTWTVYAISYGRISHSVANGSVYYQTEINGVGGPLSWTGVATGGDYVPAVAVAVGITGTVTLSSSYQNRQAGTASAGYSHFTMFAVRTA